MEILVARVENNEQMMRFGSTDIFDADDRSAVAFAGSTSVIVRSTNGSEVSRSTVVSAGGRTSAFNKK